MALFSSAPQHHHIIITRVAHALSHLGSVCAATVAAAKFTPPSPLCLALITCSVDLLLCTFALVTANLLPAPSNATGYTGTESATGDDVKGALCFLQKLSSYLSTRFSFGGII